MKRTTETSNWYHKMEILAVYIGDAADLNGLQERLHFARLDFDALRQEGKISDLQREKAQETFMRSAEKRMTELSHRGDTG